MEFEPILGKDAIREIIGRVAAQHQVVIKEDDPAFFFATICAAVTERALADAGARLDASASELRASSEGVQRAAIAKIADETKKAIGSIQRERQGSISNSLSAAWPFVGIIAVLALVLGYVAGAMS